MKMRRRRRWLERLLARLLFGRTPKGCERLVATAVVSRGVLEDADAPATFLTHRLATEAQRAVIRWRVDNDVYAH